MKERNLVIECKFKIFGKRVYNPIGIVCEAKPKLEVQMICKTNQKGKLEFKQKIKAVTLERFYKN